MKGDRLDSGAKRSFAVALLPCDIRDEPLAIDLGTSVAAPLEELLVQADALFRGDRPHFPRMEVEKYVVAAGRVL